MMRKLNCIKLFVWVLLVAVSLFPDFGRAAMIRKSLEQMHAEADTIVLGTVVRKESAWNSRRTAIYTDVTMTVEEAIKGSPGAEVTFRVPGGVVGNIGMRTSTDAVFQDGERIILFLKIKGVAAGIVGLRQGKYTVTDDSVQREGKTMKVGDFISAIRAASQTK